tara:strand:- start:35700 stop:36182 length:483 start_codon:yes stop_codon:yes gene_type:complete
MTVNTVDTTEVNKDFVARLMAVQAFYQMIHNKKPMRVVVAELLDRGLVTNEDESFDESQSEFLDIRPNGGLFKKILFNLDERYPEIQDILDCHTKERHLESLLKSVLLCGICEILVHTETDVAIILNDYLNVTHEFYDQKQVSFVNGVLDAIAKLLREAA